MKRPTKIELHPHAVGEMTAADFEAWMQHHGMDKRDAATFFTREPRTIDAWRKGRLSVPAYAVSLIEARGMMRAKKKAERSAV